MQKVITITTHFNILSQESQIAETEYPKLNEYLEKGYKVTQVVPLAANSDRNPFYSITFVLEKAD